jgi:8-amino-7-oxononanoate synthase
VTPAFVRKRLRALRQAALLRDPPTLEFSGPVHARLGDRNVAVFCGNDYLGLRFDPRVMEAAAAGARRWGAGSGSSRLIAGSLPPHAALEEELADWLGTPAALVCASGYQANLAVLAGLTGRGDLVISDALNHASIVDGCRLSRADVRVVPHGTAADALSEPGQGAWRGGEAAGERFVIVEGLYSMDGNRGRFGVVPPGSTPARVDGGGPWLIVDEAHALGVLGPGGRGAAREAGAATLATVGTFGKAFGSHGAFVATDRDTRGLLVNAGRSYVFSTGLPPASVEAARAALGIIRSDEGEQLRARLGRVIARFREGVALLGLDLLGDVDQPIAPLVVGSEHATLGLSASLLGAGVYAKAIRPPTVAAGASRIRFTLSAAHSDQDVDRALEALADAMAG